MPARGDAIGPFEVNRVHCGDALEMLRQVPDGSLQTTVTSPPYFWLRDYGIDGQLGHEATPGEYIDKLVEIFEEVRRATRADGTLWLNLGDSYASRWPSPTSRRNLIANPMKGGKRSADRPERMGPGLKEKDLIGIPWEAAFALRRAGWYLRCDVIWSKPNPMPESVTDRPTRAHEYLFLFAKSERYFYDSEAIKENLTESTIRRINQPTFESQAGGPKDYRNGTNENRSVRRTLENFAGKVKREKQRGHGRRHAGFNDRWDHMTHAEQAAQGRNKRSVWEIATKPFNGAHFATFPPDLVRPCILAGSRPGDLVCDPFSGSGTAGEMAIRLGRRFVGFDLNPEYCRELAAARLQAAERGQTVEEMESGQMTIFDALGGQGENGQRR